MLLRSPLAEGPALLGTCRPKHRRGSGLAGRLLGLGGGGAGQLHGAPGHPLACQDLGAP